MGIERFGSLEMTPSMTREEFAEKTKGFRIDYDYEAAMAFTRQCINQGLKSAWFAMKKLGD